MDLRDRLGALKFLIHDRDPLFTTAFREVFKAEGLRIITTLPRTPRMNDKVQRARELLAAIGLADRERSVPGELSGGQQQRVAIARALINRPRILLADEPTGNLDSAAGREIVDLLLRLRETGGMTLIIATHNVEVAASCDRVVAVHDGRIVSDDRLALYDSQLVLDRICRLRQVG